MKRMGRWIARMYAATGLQPVAAGGDYDLHSSSTPVSLPARMVRTEKPNSGGRREIEIRPEAAPGTDMLARRTATRVALA
jgi:hypothetical protein